MSGFTNLTLTGTSGFSNIHDVALPASGGTYLADGRAIKPDGDFSGATATAGLEVFDGVNANGTWTLFLVDLALGDQSTLVSWGMDITVLPDPFSYAGADPLDSPYWRSFQINTIGVVGTGGEAEYRQLMLTNTGGVMPRNVKVGFASGDAGMMRGAGGYYDYLPTVLNLQSSLDKGRATDMPLGIHLNAMPWNDSATQSGDILHNFLEKYNGGALLQVDRSGRIRMASLAQDPTLDEAYGTFAPQLEMQLSLSAYAPLVQDYLVRDTRLAARYFAWLREQSPDIVTFCTMSSEFAMNYHANNDYCDYSVWSKQEFRDWLSGAGAYTGQGQYASLAAFNTAFTNASGFPWASWAAVEPPVTVLWNATPNGSWWQKWQEFRVTQVRNIEQVQMRAARSAGWSPDQLFGHQIPGTAGATNSAGMGLHTTLFATPWTTTFVAEGSGGITTYGTVNTADTNLFNALYADDKNWGICEYNPLSTNVAVNLNALNAVWNSKAHLVVPYNWVQLQYTISNTPFMTALQQFIGNHSNDALANMAAYETAPASRDVLWTMSYPEDVAQASGLTNLMFTNGVFSGDITGPAVSLALALDGSRHALVSDAYFAASLRLFFSNAPAGPATLEWTGTNNVTASVAFNVRQGWNLCRVNLAENSTWRERRIKALTLKPPGGDGNGLQLDWLRLEAGHCWHFEDTNEVYGVGNFTGWAVTNGQFTGTSGADGYFYLATDKRSSSEHADRAFIDADFYKKVRVRLTSAAPASGQLYWWKGNETPYVTSFPVSAGTQTYEINLSTDTNWSGVVTRFRLDPVNTNGVACAVDFVALSPLLLPPRAPLYDTIANSPNPVFLWEPATEPDHAPLTYDFQLATDFDFTNVLFATVSQSPTNVTYAGPELDGLHWWRVRSRDGGGNVSPWLVPLPLFVRVWNGDTTNDFTGLHGLTNVVATNGVWTALTGADPYFSLNSGNNNTGPGVNADVYKQVQVRLRVDKPGASSTAQLFFFPKAGGTYSVNFTVPPDGQWYERTVDLSANTNWTGYLNSIRFDLTTSSNATVSVDWVRLVPGSAFAPNQPPVLPALSNVVIMAGSNLTVNAAATDPDAPAQTLAYSLATAPAGASVNPTNGLFSWRPAIAQSPSTNPVVLTVTDSGVPPLSATQSFQIIVTPPAKPFGNSVAYDNGQFRVNISGPAGLDYILQTTTNLNQPNWVGVATNLAAVPPLVFTNLPSPNINRLFYRVLLGP
ncbi:MAG: Ig domain-containing protein [Verrucomicrobia bacterium]|nr:Ig domain-containing protein [Verrucomicrobiota bacterium]